MRCSGCAGRSSRDSGSDPSRSSLMTRLHEAVAESDVERVRELLAEGVDVNARDEDGATPLHYAGGERDSEIVRLLLEAGADLSLVDRQGQTAYDWAMSTCRGDIMAPILLM